MALPALTTAAGVSGLYGQKVAADNQAAYNQNQYNNALTARSQNANQLAFKMMQQNDAAGQKINVNNQTQQAAQSALVARAGPTGISVDQLLANLGTKGASYNQSVNENLGLQAMADNNEFQNINNAASSTINSLRTPTPPDYLGAGLKIATSQYEANQKIKAVA